MPYDKSGKKIMPRKKMAYSKVKAAAKPKKLKARSTARAYWMREVEPKALYAGNFGGSKSNEIKYSWVQRSPLEVQVI